jgi:hypothetical protein
MQLNKGYPRKKKHFVTIMRHPIVHLPNQAFYLSNVFELELMTLVKMACLMANLVTLYECFTFDKD